MTMRATRRSRTTQNPGEAVSEEAPARPCRTEFRSPRPSFGFRGGSKIGNLVVLALLAGSFFAAWEFFLSAALDEGNFNNATLHEYGDLGFEGGEDTEDVFRSGKAIVVNPGGKVIGSGNALVDREVKVHAAWHKMRSSARAGSPAEVKTVVLLDVVRGESRTYQVEDGLRKKVATENKVVIELYDWPSKSFLGRKVFAPPSFAGEIMTDDQLDAMRAAISPSTVGAYLTSLPVQAP